MTKTQSFDVIVLGGGASGLMAALIAAENGHSVLVLEKNAVVGKKLSISGGGRCNITNAEHDLPTLLRSYGKSEHYLYSAFSQFGVAETFAFFESHGLPLSVQANKRAFPRTEKAADVVAVFERALDARGVKVVPESAVVRIVADEDVIREVVCKDATYQARSFVLATGGASRPETGSTGDGFMWLKALGHTVEEPTPSIVPLIASDEWVHSLAGVSIQNAKITFFVDGKKEFSKLGRILFTHFGLSGPLILNNSKRVGDMLHEGVITAAVDLDPTNDIGALERRMVATFDEHKNKALKNCIAEIVPEGMAKGLLVYLEGMVDLETKVHSVTRATRRTIAEAIKAMPVRIEGLMGFDKAVVADGGVILDEVDMRTMRSKKIANLFITGDLLHIYRPSGGYSLQLCWTTGYVAGKNA